MNFTVAVLSVSVWLLLLGMARDGLFGVMPAALSTIASEHPEGIVVAEPDGYLTYANRRAHELLTPVALAPSRNVLHVLQDPVLEPETTLPADLAGQDDWWRALCGPTGVLFRKHGRKTRWLQVIATRLGEQSASDRGWLLHVSDVTLRHQAELHSAQTRRLESVAALALTVSRDFQGAFSVVRGNAEFLEREVQDEQGQRHLARIFEAANLGADLAHELQLYAGTAHSLHSRHDLSRAVAETCELLESDLPRNVQIHRRASARLLPIEADAIQLRDCLFHLLNNAVDATKTRGGPIEIATGCEHVDPGRIERLVWGREQPAAHYAYVEIRDEGGGMEPDVEERAFEPFFSTRHKDRGNGLSTVLGIARSHDALIALDNSPGWGCTVTLYFPLCGEA
jgi:signal transduction histidine kinase